MGERELYIVYCNYEQIDSIWDTKEAADARIAELRTPYTNPYKEVVPLNTPIDAG